MTDTDDLLRRLRETAKRLDYSPDDWEDERQDVLAAIAAIESLTAERDQIARRCNELNDDANALRAENEALKRDAAEVVRCLKLIEHATAPEPKDGGEHENAYTLARQALSLLKWGVV